MKYIKLFKDLLQLIKYFDSSLKWKLYLVLLISVVGGVLEMAGVGLVFPIIKIAINDQNDLNLFFFSLDEFSNYSKDNLIIILLIFFILFFLLKNLVLSIFTYKQYNLLADVRIFISSTIFKKYIYSNYDYFIENNSSLITRNLTTVVHNFNNSVILALSIILTEIFVLFFLIFLCFYINPFGSIIIFITLFTPAILIYIYLKPKLKSYGDIIQLDEANRIKKINELIHGIKEIKIFGKDNFFINSYNYSEYKISKANAKNTFINQSNKYWLELILIFSLSIYIFWDLNNGNSFEKLLPTLGFYALAAFRVIPSLNRLMNMTQILKFSEPIIKTVRDELHSFNSDINYKKKKNKIEFKKNIIFKNISYKYPNHKKYTLKNFDLEIIKGKTLGIYGKTGSGKTTFLNLLLGLINQRDGQILIDDKPVNNRSLGQIISFVPQDNFLIDDSIIKNIILDNKLSKKTNDRVFKILKQLKLDSFINSLKFGVDTIIGERGLKLSGGQKQRITIARALYFKRDIVIFDEATSSLDYETEDHIIKTLKLLKKKFTVIIVAHRLNTLNHCDYKYEIKNGNALKRL